VTWEPDSWRRCPVSQQPEYPDGSRLDEVLAELRRLPPLVSSWEVLLLRQQLAEAAAGRSFVLQGGDCAERFQHCTSDRIANTLKVLLQMSLVLVVGAQRPVIRIGRFAGQYAKPRSADLEKRNGIELPSYRGDNVNRPEFTAEARTPDPQLLLRGYERAALTLNFIRSLVKSGFADLHHPEYFDLDWVDRSPLADEYHRTVETIGEALRFMENVLGVRAGETDRIDFFTAHEALHLPYEAAQTRSVPRHPGWFNLAAHFPWAGLRTNEPCGAHIEYLRGIENPVGVKIGPGFTREQVARWIDILDPRRTPGRLTFIHRFGATHIGDALPQNFGFHLLSRSGPQALSTVMLDKFAPVSVVHRADTVLALLLSFFLITNAARMFWFLTEGKDIPARLYLTELWHLAFQGATQSRWRQCKTNVRNWLRHLFLVTGYVTIFLLVVLFLPWFQVQDHSFRWTSILGYYSTAAVLVTTIWIIIERFREKPESHLSDWLFPILLCLTAASGIVVNVLRLNNLPMPTYVAYMVHLMIAVPMLVVEVPFGKWTHLVYRPLALYVLAVRDRSYQLTSAAQATTVAEAVPHAV
jgi:3-deoxy-7-phosphoheptulonate synthase